ncbi:MAG: LamG domain-containing protein [Dehalococcoidia bacterium]|nr:LamG domain-containing protein [Dehalococcoidia bacterium]
MRILKSTGLMIVGTVVLVATGMLVSSSYAEIDPETVIGVWLFDTDPQDGVADSSGNGHDGVLQGNVDWVQGKFGKALEFPGISGNLVSIPHTPELNLVDFTIVAWYKGEATDSWQYLVSKEIPHKSRNYSIGINKDTNVMTTQITVGAEQWKTSVGKTVLTDGEWHHMAGTYDGTFIKSWVNGVMEGQVGEQGEPDHPEEQPLRIGAVNGIPTKGIIDEVALFSVALEEEEIQEIMNDGLAAALQILAVDPAEKLTVTWGSVKAQY